jgi:hypothetical protein
MTVLSTPTCGWTPINDEVDASIEILQHVFSARRTRP